MAKDWGWVTNRIAVGGAITSMFDARRVASDGVTHVLNVRTNQDEVPFVQKAGMSYASNPTKDQDTKTKPPLWFRQSADIISAALSQKGAKILVHCQGGMNRGPISVYFFLRSMGLKKDLCTQLIVDARPIAKNMDYVDDAEAALDNFKMKG